MAAAMGISNAAAIAALNAIVDLLDAGSGPGKIRIYDGTRPTDVDTAVGSQVLLAELTLSDPAFGNAVDDTPGALAVASAITADASANASGTATWYRALDSDNNAVIDGNVGTTSADLILSSTIIVATEPVTVLGWTIFLGES
jgi:hypothetical protein